MANMDKVSPKINVKSPKFMDQLRMSIRANNLSYATEKTYCFWVKRYIRFHSLKHPKTLTPHHVEQFLHHLAVVENVSVNTQKTAFNAS